MAGPSHALAYGPCEPGCYTITGTGQGETNVLSSALTVFIPLQLTVHLSWVMIPDRREGFAFSAAAQPGVL